VGDVPFHPTWAIEVTHPLWKSLTSTDNNEFTRWRHSAPFWRHHNYISYLLWCWSLLSFRVGFSYIVRIICDGLCTLSKYRFWILIVCWLLPLCKTTAFGGPIGTKISDLLHYSIWLLAFRWFLRSQHELTIWFVNWEMCNTRSVNCTVTNNCRLLTVRYTVHICNRPLVITKCINSIYFTAGLLLQWIHCDLDPKDFLTWCHCQLL